MEYIDLIKSRYSVRNFKPDIIPLDIIKKVIDFSLMAPSAKNKQPYKTYFITNEHIINELKNTIKSIGNCKNLMLITKLEKEAWINKRRNNYSIADIDVGIFATYLMLSAWEYGIGSCMIGMFDDKDVRCLIELSEDESPALFIAFGYLAEDSKPSLEYHYDRKKTEQILTVLDYYD